MVDICLEVLVIAFTAVILMLLHEGVKVIVYALCQKGTCRFRTSPWQLWRYIDPVGLLLAVVCYVPISKPYFFRIQDKKTNRILGFCGFFTLFLVFLGSVLAIRFGYGGLEGMDHLRVQHWWEKLLPMFVQCLALLSLDMFIVNFFPISIFDAGLCLAGYSSRLYLSMIQSDGIIKLILMLVLFLDLIHFGAVRLLALLL